MKLMTRYAPVAVVLALCCLPLTACGTQQAGERTAATSGPGSSARDETSDDQGSLPDETTDDGQSNLPDETSDDQGSLPDTTSDDQGSLPDTTSDDQGSLPDETSDDQGTDDPASGPHRWFPMLREFRAYLTTDGPKADAALASHVTSVHIRVPADSARSVAVVRVDFGVGEQDSADRTAKVFGDWRRALYGDHGHVEVLGPAKTTAERNW
ncbi:hypothetical protein [Streptomyces soliscabiei]|uniref:hypothetical protein n=1 Tax=Streptomyces soliscabiei TaxID=588897 RepID=UPI0029AA8C95|nr:hypothetical protein [Streptomyces sp. NY05-11A]MDX2679023.1 hypothetical protein [Streptomyces sp. NY05-11A]